ncbi:MAG: biopolymer transport protein ExbD [Saprospiraceae bacterium]|jgi:biopolymer transport protein ExbD
MKLSRISSTVSAGSMADIAFLLLSFFFVTTTIASDKGITVLLPPIDNTPPIPLSEDRVLTLLVNGNDDVLFEGEYLQLDEIAKQVISFLEDRFMRDIQPVVSLQVDRKSSYEVYIASYDAIKSAYALLRQTASQSSYQKDYKLLTSAKQRLINKLVPMIISEADPVAYFE